MKRLGLVLAACVAMSGAYAAPAWDTGYAYGANHCYGFHAPAGWAQDNRLLANKGVPMVFLPQDSRLAGGAGDDLCRQYRPQAGREL